MAADRPSAVKHDPMGGCMFVWYGWRLERPHGKSIFDLADGAQILEAFLSKEMEDMHGILQYVEWDMNLENDGRVLSSVYRLGGDGTIGRTGEMTFGFGSPNAMYDVSDTSTVDAYSSDFDSLVSSYPTRDEEIRKSTNPAKIAVGLVHSVLVAKHLGAQKLKAIRRYYSRYRLPSKVILQRAFELLLMQTNTRIPHDGKIWKIFEPSVYRIAIFPY